MHILLVEDDKDIIRTLSELLVKSGYMVDVASRQSDAVALACNNSNIDLVLLDITLEEGNGFAVCSAIKSFNPDIPIVFLTASDDEFNTVAGLSMGADDYIAKPFRPRELMARIEAVLRRTNKAEKPLMFGDILIDPRMARASKGAVELELSAIEYKLLLLFASNAGGIVTRDMIREALWEDASAYVEDNTLSVYVKRLREKIEDDPTNPQLIKTVRGLGYRAIQSR